MRLRWFTLLACVGCSTYVHHRAALVPHGAPVHTIGQPSEWLANASLGASNIADLGAPEEGSDPNAGVAVPSRQLRGSLLIALTRNLSMGWAVEDGLASSAQPIKDTLPPLDNTPLIGHGPLMTYSIATGSPLRIGLSFEAIAWRVPWVEYVTCIDNCAGQPLTVVNHEVTGVLTAAFGVVPSYRVGDLIAFAGITARHHPSIREKIISNGIASDVVTGPLNAIVHAGVAYEAGHQARFIVELHQTLSNDPVAYAPGLGFAVEVGFGPRVPRKHTPVDLPPGAPAPLELRHAEAVDLTAEARREAQRGECEHVRELDSRVRVLDRDYHASVFLRDALIAYCVSP